MFWGFSACHSMSHFACKKNVACDGVREGEGCELYLAVYISKIKDFPDEFNYLK